MEQVHSAGKLMVLTWNFNKNACVRIARGEKTGQMQAANAPATEKKRIQLNCIALPRKLLLLQLLLLLLLALS